MKRILSNEIVLLWQRQKRWRRRRRRQKFVIWLRFNISQVYLYSILLLLYVDVQHRIIAHRGLEHTKHYEQKSNSKSKRITNLSKKKLFGLSLDVCRKCFCANSAVCISNFLRIPRDTLCIRSVQHWWEKHNKKRKIKWWKMTREWQKFNYAHWIYMSMYNTWKLGGAGCEFNISVRLLLVMKFSLEICSSFNDLWLIQTFSFHFNVKMLSMIKWTFNLKSDSF